MKRLSLLECTRKKCKNLGATYLRKKSKSHTRTILRKIRKKLHDLDKQLDVIIKKGTITRAEENERIRLIGEVKKYKASFGEVLWNKKNLESRRTARRASKFNKKLCRQNCDPTRKKASCAVLTKSFIDTVMKDFPKVRIIEDDEPIKKEPEGDAGVAENARVDRSDV